MKEVLIFGGGNIGRSFLTPVLQDAGYKVILVDIDKTLIESLRQRGEYAVVTRSAEGETSRRIRGFDCIGFEESQRLEDALLKVPLMVSAVGKTALPSLCCLLARILPERNRAGTDPVDLILAENLRGAAEVCRTLLKKPLPSGYPLDKQLGLVETSIGKMVPLLTEADREEDGLRLFAEPYNTLILDREGFLRTPPSGPGIRLVAPIAAWVDRKLYIHNLGHAAAAYLGRRAFPDREMIWEVLEDGSLRRLVRQAMREAAAALRSAYPGVFTPEDLDDHIADLLARFRNRALGDTVQRVGRDLRRKLHREDRIIGAARLAAYHRLPFGHILQVYRAAVSFGAHSFGEDPDRSVSLSAVPSEPEVFYRSFSLSGALPDPVDLVLLDALREES